MGKSAVEHIGIIGFGNMGEALYKGLKKKNSAIKLSIIEKAPVRRALAVKKYKAQDFGDNPLEFFKTVDCLVLAIKPQDLKAYLEGYRHAMKGCRVITILAGTPLSAYTGICPDTEFARCMPNLAASVGKAVTGVSFSANASDAFKVQARFVVEAMGSCVEIPEHLMPGITALSGSGIALVFQFINAMAMGSVRQGIPYAQAYPAVLDVLAGAVEVLKKEEVHPMEMVSRVCSPAGTTIEGIHALEAGHFNATVMDALAAISDKVKIFETPKS